MGEKIKILIVDDSAIVRAILTEELSKIEEFEIVGVAPDPYVARNLIIEKKPDVITLDIEMPRMDGLTFLGKLSTYYPMPVIIVSSITTNDKMATIKALELGAFDIVNKPSSNLSVSEVINEIVEKIKNAYLVKDSYATRRELIQKRLLNNQTKLNNIDLSKYNLTDKIIAIGSSTGGTLALEYIIKELPVNMPPIVITQHMPKDFTYQFARRLNEISNLTVKESEDGEQLNNGYVYIAKGDYHMEIERRGNLYYIKHSNSEKIHFQRPSVDVMFKSLATSSGKNTIAFLLTGMGKDGAEGLLMLKNSGAYTLCQDEESSIVWGMPKAGIDINAHREIISLEKIPSRIIELVKNY